MLTNFGGAKAPMTNDEQATLDRWADRIAALTTRQASVAMFDRMAADERRDQVDREFAKAHAAAIRRAIRRANSRQRKLPSRRRR